MCAVYNALDCDMINAIKIQKTSRSQLFFCGDLGIISVVPPKNLRKFAMCKFTNKLYGDKHEVLSKNYCKGFSSNPIFRWHVLT